MEKKNLSELTDAELIVEKKKLKKSKMISAIAIGFLAGIVFVGIASSIIAKNILIIIPLLFPLYFIYKLITNQKKNNEMELILNERNLN